MIEKNSGVSSFDNKVYDIIKSGKNNDIPNVSKPRFNDVYPVGSVFFSNSTTCPLTYGTWKLSGIYGVHKPDPNYDIVFNKDYVIFHLVMDAGGSKDWEIAFNVYFNSDVNIKTIIGQTYTSPQSGLDPNTYYNFYDDKGGWYCYLPNTTHLKFHGEGLGITSRRYECSVMLKVNDLSYYLNAHKITTDKLTFEFTRTE